MPYYSYRCPMCGKVDDLQHGIKDEIFVACATCVVPAVRYFGPENVPEFTEDRVRFKDFRHSLGLGKPMPDDRRSLRAIEKEKGIEFIGKREMPELWKKAAEHHRYVKEGGTPLSPEVLNPRQTAVEPGTIMKKVREKGLRFG